MLVMLFKQAQEVVDGRKRQTRRPVKPGEKLCWVSKTSARLITTDTTSQPSGARLSVVKFYPSGYWRLKWQVGKDYAAQPGRGKKSIGRTPPIKEIRRERLWDITEEDAKEEGIKRYCGDGYVGYYKTRFLGLWNSIYRKPYRWRDNPEVWVLEFEPI